MLQGIFKQKEPRKFSYKTCYYNKENEDIRRGKIRDGENDTKVNFGVHFRKKVDKNRRKSDNSMKKLMDYACDFRNIVVLNELLKYGRYYLCTSR